MFNLLLTMTLVQKRFSKVTAVGNEAALAIPH